MKAETITIGDEVLRGEIVDSNKAHLATRLRTLDVETRFQTSVLDAPDDMADALRRAVERVDFVLVSGGLGPTRDDLTAQVMADTFGCPLELHEPSLEVIRAFFRAVGRDMTENNAKQAWFPRGADVLANPIGTAPGFMLEAQGVPIFCLPGVPRELYKMMEEQVLPRIASRRGDVPVQRAVLLRTFGTGESTLDAELGDLFGADSDVELGFRTAFPDNYLRPVARGVTAQEAEGKIADAADAIRERLGAIVYGEGEDTTLEAVVGDLLRDAGRTVATAESCTGGLIAEKFTAIAGSSDYFLGGVVAYANSAKQSMLGVPEAMLIEHGAVSEPVARAMAEGVRERFGADFGVSTTGISGPGGGTDEKPVGLVYVGIASDAGTHVGRFVFGLDRERHRVLTAQLGLDWVRRSLLGEPLEGPSLMRRGGGSAPGHVPSGGAKSGGGA